MEPDKEVIIDEDYVAKRAEFEEALADQPESHKHRFSDSLADKIYEEIKEKNIMKKFEDLKCNEDVLCIWGFKFPTDNDEANKAIHHALLDINELSLKDRFRIIYFHTNVNGSGK